MVDGAGLRFRWVPWLEDLVGSNPTASVLRDEGSALGAPLVRPCSGLVGPWLEGLLVSHLGATTARRMMITVDDLLAIDDPLALFKLSTQAIGEYQDAIDTFAEIRARAVGALYSQGYTYKDLGALLGMSAPRVGQIVNSNDVAALEVLKAWNSIESLFPDIIGLLAPGRPVRNPFDALNIIRSSKTLDRDVILALEDLRKARNELVHGKISVTTDQANVLVDKAIFVRASIILWMRKEAERIRRESSDGDPSI